MRIKSCIVVVLLALKSAMLMAGEPMIDALEELRLINKETENRHIRVLESEFIKSKHADRGKIGLVLADLFAKKSPRLSATYLNAATNRIEDRAWRARSNLVAAAVALKRGQYHKALAKVSPQVIDNLNETMVDEGRKLRLKIIYELKNYRQFAREYKDFFGRHRSAKIDESLRRDLALSYQKLGWKSKEREVLEGLAEVYPLTPLAVWAFGKIVAGSCHSNYANPTMAIRAKFLERLSRNDSPDSGKKEAILALIDTPLEDSQGKLKLFRGVERLEFLVKARLYDEAQAFSEVLLQDSLVNRRSREKILLLAGRIYEIKGNYPQALLTYGKYLREFRSRRKRIDVSLNIGQILANMGHHSAAEAHYHSLSKKTRRRVVKWLRFWAAFRSENYLLAKSLLLRKGYLTPMDRQFNGSTIYWLARVNEKLNLEDDATQEYRKLLNKYPSSYYSNIALARNPWLNEDSVSKGLMASMRQGVNISIADDGEIEFEDDNGFIAAEQNLPMMLSSFLSGSTAYHGLDFVPANDNEIFWLAGNGPSALSSSPKNNSLQKDYPLPFYDYIANFSQLANVDILMIYSLMRAESRFDADAASHVGAMGLMQIMPYTGSKIADLVGDEAFTAEKLKVPVTNIAYGVHYLGLLSDLFGESPFVAAAAYNAGPKAAIKWLTRCQNCEFDEFVESISYRETRRYVKKIIENLGYYSRLYRAQVPLSTLPTLPSDLPKPDELF